MRLLPIFILIAALGVVGKATAQSPRFEDFYPNRVGRTLVFEYSSVAEGASQWSYQGTLTRSPGGEETRNGVTYEIVTHTTEGLPDFYPGQWKSYHRETEDGLYSGQLNESGEVEEHLELPAAAEAGEAWRIRSEFWQSETITPVPRVETQGGTFSGCIRAERRRREEASQQILINSTTYCPGVSAVRSTVEHVFPEFRSVTELELADIR